MSLRAQFEQRLQNFRQQLAAAKQDAALIFSLDNLRYVYNYSGEAAYGVVTQTSLVLITDYRFVEQAEEECVRDYLPTTVVCRDRDHEA